MHPEHVRTGPASRAAATAALVLIAACLIVGCGAGSSAQHPDGVSYTPPSYQDWPMFGRDRNATFYAPQTQISTRNVKHLGLAWSTSLGPEQFLVEGYPVESRGTLYITTSSDEIQAYNATTGKRKWQYAPRVDFSQSTGVGGYGVTTNRGVAMANGNVFELSFDDHLRAVSAATGEELWSTSVVSSSTGAYETMAPSAADGLVFVGVSGSQDGIRGFVAAYDQRTGKQVWRFYTVPAAGHGWVPKGGGGGGVYMPPTVDPRTGLVYAGTSTPAPVIYGVGRKGPDLYSDSILALHIKTGKLAWYHQEVPHDLWDYGADSPVMLFTLDRDGTQIPALAEAGKDGHVYVLNARTGKQLYAPPAYVREHHPIPNRKGTLVCPGSVGGSPYSPLALDPKESAAYVSGVNLCQVLKVQPAVIQGERAFAGVRSTPDNETPTGTFDAVNLKTGGFLWKRRMATPMVGGAAATAGNVVFTGDQHGNFYALDAATGKTLWEGNVGLAFGSAPIVYTVGGTEYVAVAVGGSATTAANHLGPTGARLDVFKLGGRGLAAARPTGGASHR